MKQSDYSYLVGARLFKLFIGLPEDMLRCVLFGTGLFPLWLWLCCGDMPVGEDDCCGLFFQGWNPLPTAASARGGGDLFDSLLHCAANIANGVPLRPGCSYQSKRKHFNEHKKFISVGKKPKINLILLILGTLYKLVLIIIKYESRRLFFIILLDVLCLFLFLFNIFPYFISNLLYSLSFILVLISILTRL